MPSSVHEVLVGLFRTQPSLAVELLSDSLRFVVPAHDEVVASSAELTEVVPAELRADTVLLVQAREQPVLGVVVEVQLTKDAKKQWSWPSYLISLRSRHRCPVVLLVISPHPAVAAWCTTPIETGHPGWALTPLVLGPTQLPVVTDPDLACQHPAQAVLSAIAHSEHPEREQIFHALFAALDNIDLDLAARYTDFIFAALPEAAQAYLETLMTTGTYEYKSDFARRYFHQGRTEGLAEGRTEGLAEGRTEGLAEGRAEGEVKALLTILTTRGIQVPDDARTRITTCTDLDQLETWIQRSITAATIHDILDK